MRLRELMDFATGPNRNALRDIAPMAVQNDGVTAITCGCSACAGKLDYTPTSEPFDGDLFAIWTQQDESGSMGRLAPDGPMQVNEPNDVIPGTTLSTYTLTLGQSETGVVNTVGDDDWFRVELVAGQSYVFTLTGSGGTPLSDPFLQLYSSNGRLVHLDDDGGPGTSSLLRFTATTSGRHYINARAWEDTGFSITGGYTLTFDTGAPQDPLDTLELNYVFPDNTINVYFTTQGEVNSGDTALRNWTQAEINSVMSALSTISAVTPLVFTQVFSSAQSDFRLSIAELGTSVLGHFFVGAGNGAFDPDGAGWNSAGMAPGSLAYATIVHEILHGLGLGHPHYDGGDTQVTVSYTHLTLPTNREV